MYERDFTFNISQSEDDIWHVQVSEEESAMNFGCSGESLLETLYSASWDLLQEMQNGTS